MSKFKLKEEIYLNKDNNRVCRRYTPAIDVFGKQYWWVEYLDGDKDITLVHKDYLEILKNGKVLFSEDK